MCKSWVQTIFYLIDNSDNDFGNENNYNDLNDDDNENNYVDDYGEDDIDYNDDGTSLHFKLEP